MDEQQAVEAAAEPVESQVSPHGPSTSRAEHLQWCKDRANAYLPADPMNAFASIMSDLRKHKELASHPGIELGGMQMMLPGWIDDARKVGHFIDGFN